MEQSYPTCSLIIATYNWPEALNLILKSILRQSKMPKEVIIADDGSTDETRRLIESYKDKISVPLIHVWHEDLGFRKTIILNQAIKKATGEYIVQIDGDIILHRHFIKDHVSNAKKGYFIKGSRGRLTAQKSQQVLMNENINIFPLQKGIKSIINATYFPILRSLFYGKPNNTRNIKGCNFAVWKEDFVKVNGYNNDIAGWGHEDIELAARLVNSGIKSRQLKMAAVCYHIYHKFISRDKEDYNFIIYEDVIKNKIMRCKNGYDQV